MRREMIEQRQGEMRLRVRVHCDDMVSLGPKHFNIKLNQL